MEKLSTYRFAVCLLAAVSVIFFLTGISATFPLLLLVIPAWCLATRVPAESWERMAMVPLFVMILAGFLVYAFALYDAYTPTRGICAAIVLNVAAIVELWSHSRESGNPVLDPRFRGGDVAGWEKIAAAGLAVVIAIVFFYGMAFPFIGFTNEPYCAFVQLGLYIRRHGGFYLLTPIESAYNTIPFLYTPAFPGLIAWLSSFVPQAKLGLALGFVAPLLLMSFCGIFLALGLRLAWRPMSSLLALLLILPSYAIFRVVLEIESDTPGFACGALFLYFLIRLTEGNKASDSRTLWMFTGLVWAYGWWVRSYLGIFFSFALLCLLMFSGEARTSFGSLFQGDLRPWVRPIRIGGLLLLVMVGPFWETVLWIHAGSPIAPKSVKPMGIRIAVIKPEFDRYRPPAAPDETPKTRESRFQREAPLVVYDFLPIVTDQGWKKNIFKSTRALVHGNTFSGAVTLLFLVGICLSLSSLRRRGLFSMSGVALSYLAGVPVLLASNHYYYKILYAAVPLVAFFSGTVIQRCISSSRRRENLAGMVALFMTLVFVISFLWSGVGTWPEERRWGLFKIHFRSPYDREWLKNGDVLQPALAYLRLRPMEERYLYFHGEPGAMLSTALDRRPFWEEYHYDSRRLAGLHRLKTRAKVLAALHALRIKHIVLTFELKRYLQTGEADLLPRMLMKGDPALELVASSSNAVYKIYRVR